MAALPVPVLRRFHTRDFTAPLSTTSSADLSAKVAVVLAGDVEGNFYRSRTTSLFIDGFVWISFFTSLTSFRFLTSKESGWKDEQQDMTFRIVNNVVNKLN